MFIFIYIWDWKQKCKTCSFVLYHFCHLIYVYIHIALLPIALLPSDLYTIFIAYLPTALLPYIIYAYIYKLHTYLCLCTHK